MMFQRIALLALFLSILATAKAQPSFTCDDGQRYAALLTLELDSSGTLTYLSVIGQEPFDPVLHLIEDGQPVACSDYRGRGSSISARLPGVGDVPPSLNSVQESSGGPQRWQIAEYSGRAGAFLLLLEGVLLDDLQPALSFELALAEAARVPDAALYIFAFSETPLAAGDLLLSSADWPAEAVPAEAFVDSYVTIQNMVLLEADEASVGLRLALDGAPQTLSFTLSSASEEPAPVVLALHLSVPEQLPQARAYRDVTGALRLECDGAPQPGRIVEALLPDQANLIVTLLMDELGDPLLALVDEAGSGICAEDTPAAHDYGLALPDLEFAASPLSAQGIARAGRALIVQRNTESKDALILVEGLRLTSSGDMLRLLLPPDFAQGGEVEAFLIAEEDEGDPLLALVADDGSVLSDALGAPLICDNAGSDEECYESVSLAGVLLTRGDGALLRALELDARLLAPQEQLETGALRWWLASANEETSAAVLLLRLRFP